MRFIRFRNASDVMRYTKRLRAKYPKLTPYECYMLRGEVGALNWIHNQIRKALALKRGDCTIEAIYRLRAGLFRRRLTAAEKRIVQLERRLARWTNRKTSNKRKRN